MAHDEPADRERDVARAVEILRAGGLVGLPTETVYGLAADASNPAAVRRIFAAKGRPVDHPVIVHLGGAAQLAEWAREVPEAARRLAAACWPGPLTLIVRRSARVLDEVTGGLDTVALRIPAHPLALAVLRAFGGGVAAPSANRFGRVSPTVAEAVREELGDAVDFVLDGGPCDVGVESTIVDVTGERPVILRPGRISAEEVEAIAGVPLGTASTTRAPGTLPAHYAPALRVRVVPSAEVIAEACRALEAGERAGVLAPGPVAGLPQGVEALAPAGGPPSYGRVLYERFREAERRGLTLLLCVPPPETGIGVAVNDRLRRAAASGAAGEDVT